MMYKESPMCICSLLQPGAGSTENRATFLKSSIATIAGAALSLTSVPGLAKAPQVKRQVSGFYRMMMGDFEITALSDGTSLCRWTRCSRIRRPLR
jgi:hypothetical protein